MDKEALPNTDQVIFAGSLHLVVAFVERKISHLVLLEQFVVNYVSSVHYHYPPQLKVLLRSQSLVSSGCTIPCAVSC